jgi:putative effector of murein hydrolase
MKKRIAREVLAFFIAMIVVYTVVDYFRGKTLDGSYFLNLLAKTAIAAVVFGVLLVVFKKQYRKYDEE